jgi:hypothetical protein
MRAAASRLLRRRGRDACGLGAACAAPPPPLRALHTDRRGYRHFDDGADQGWRRLRPSQARAACVQLAACALA